MPGAPGLTDVTWLGTRLAQSWLNPDLTAPHFPPFSPSQYPTPSCPGSCRRIQGRTGVAALSWEQSTPHFSQEQGIPFRAEGVTQRLFKCNRLWGQSCPCPPGLPQSRLSPHSLQHATLCH